MYSPPYIILLIRTFLTLEGIAGQVDPNFNIYEVSLPWAIQRALSPSTDTGAAALRASLLTRDNRLQWNKIRELMEQQLQGDDADEAGDVSATDAPAAALSSSSSSSEVATTSAASAAMGAIDGTDSATLQAQAGSGASTPLDTVAMLLGSSEGSTLRRIALDLDSTELLLKLGSQEARDIRRMSVEAIATALTPKLRLPSPKVTLQRAAALPSSVARRLRADYRQAAAATPGGADDGAGGVASGLGSEGGLPSDWPMSPGSLARRRRQLNRFAQVNSVLLRSHMQRQLASGWRGAAALATLVYVAVRVSLPGFVKALVRSGSAPASVLALGTTALATARRLPKTSLTALTLGGVVGLALVKDRIRTRRKEDEPRPSPTSADGAS